MKITATEEYGVRLILQLAKNLASKSEEASATDVEQQDVLVSLNELSQAEGITTDYVASLISKLRKAELVESVRGKNGGYKLCKDPKQITLLEICKGLGGSAFTETFCDTHTGNEEICVHSKECSVRPVWSILSNTINIVLSHISLADLMDSEDNCLQDLRERFRVIYQEEAVHG